MESEVGRQYLELAAHMVQHFMNGLEHPHVQIFDHLRAGDHTAIAISDVVPLDYPQLGNDLNARKGASSFRPIHCIAKEALNSDPCN